MSVIIVNWNSKDYLRACLQSLARHPPAGLTLEVVVVDGGSYDGCAEMLTHEFPAVRFIQSPDNIGFARANNLGATHALGDVLWLLNPDTEIKEQAAAALFHALRERADAGLVGAKLLNSDGTLQTSCVQALPTPLNQAVDSEWLRQLFPNSRLWGITALKAAATPVEVEAVPGASVMVRRKDFRAVGGFDPGYFMYGEDMDLCLKIRKYGRKVLYVPLAVVVHHGGGSSRNQFSKFSAVHMRVAVVHYLRTHFGLLPALWYRLLMAVSAVSRLLVLLPAGLLARGPVARQSTTNSRKKWTAILSWSLGGERWAYDRPGGK